MKPTRPSARKVGALKATMPFAKPTPDELKNRFKHHPAKGDQADYYQCIRDTITAAALACVEMTPCSPEQTRALNHLDEAMFLFVAAKARNE